jgi:ABC-2 type transport system ATP-binding protein
MVALDVEHISKQYEGAEQPALNNVTFTIEQGQIVGILGPNGAGKTTLISIISGLLKQDAGNITVLGHANTSMEIKYLLGVVPQEYALYFDLTPQENLWYFGKMWGIPSSTLQHRIDELLSILGLSEVKHKKLKTFSGGMKRRINLAASILNNPQILILDEPTVGVDVQSRAAIVDYLKALNKNEGMTIIYTSHLLAEAQELCDQVLIIEHGELLEQGTPAELMHKHASSNLEQVFLTLTGKTVRN